MTAFVLPYAKSMVLDELRLSYYCFWLVGSLYGFPDTTFQYPRPCRSVHRQLVSGASEIIFCIVSVQTDTNSPKHPVRGREVLTSHPYLWDMDPQLCF